MPHTNCTVFLVKGLAMSRNYWYVHEVVQYNLRLTVCYHTLSCIYLNNIRLIDSMLLTLVFLNHGLDTAQSLNYDLRKPVNMVLFLHKQRLQKSTRQNMVPYAINFLGLKKPPL